MSIIDDYQRICESAARAGGELIRSWSKGLGTREKGPADLVTEVDFAVQGVVREALLTAFPDFGFLAEEDDGSPRAKGASDQPRWIVDPIDGTVNFVHGLPGYAVSVALEERGEIVVATTYDPVAEHCFIAAAGRGAFLNGRQLKVSQAARLGDALVCASLPAKVEQESPEIAAFLAVLPRCQSMRRLGSAALNLGYLAAGWIDAYWATSTKAWDVAAGALLVREAGGVITGFDGKRLQVEKGEFVAAATEPLYAELFATLQSVPCR